MTYQKITGPVMANSHPGSYSGQDAYTDMFVTENENVLHRKWTNKSEYGRVDRSLELYARSASCFGNGGGTEMHTAVRRLTPLECERLQGYPDGWTDIGEWTDTKGKVHKESTDSARYKALGNSICLPFWKVLAKRISAQYDRDITMGSLFDGIGGFPYVFEQINGKGTARWASEIEEFPIAVTKRHFQERSE